MALAVVETERSIWHQGRSKLSGYRTRLFHDPKDASAEEAWLDDEFRAALAYWSSRMDAREDFLRRRTSQLLEVVAKDFRRGMGRVALEPNAEFGAALVKVWRSNAPDDPENVHMTCVDAGRVEHEWIGRVENDGDLVLAVQAFMSTLPTPPSP